MLIMHPALTPPLTVPSVGFSRFLRVFLPGTFRGRLLGAIIFSAVALIVVSGALFSWQTYRMLDHEASLRLQESAKTLAKDFRELSPLYAPEQARILMENRFNEDNSFGWVRNAYWVGLHSQKPAFLASFSAAPQTLSSLHPPSIDDVEDLLDDELAKLEDGLPAFPDPFSLDEERRFKIVLTPILDDDGLLTSIVGLEADMRYLNLFATVGRSMVQTLALTIPLAILLSTLLAQRFSRKIDILTNDLHCVAEHQTPDLQATGIFELDTLKIGIVSLGETIKARNLQLHDVYQEKLRELSFTGGAIAHEIRNPLSAIEVHLELIRRRYSPSDLDLEAFTDIHEQLRDIKTRIELFLNYSRKVDPRKTTISPQELLEEMIHLKTMELPDFAVDILIPEGFTMSFDPGMFRQIFENLLDNALQARPEALKVSISFVTIGENIRIEVSDNGPGIPAELRPRLFTPFATGKVGGNGIGLALVKKLIEAHNGNITCQESPEGGAWFRIEVPSI